MTDRIAYLYRRWHYRARPLPRLGADAGVVIPAWLIRVVATLGLDTMIMLAAWACGLPLPPLVVMGVGLAGWVLIRPMYQAGVLAIVVAGVFLLFAPDAGLGPSSWALMVCAYLGWRLLMAASLLPWSGAAQPRTVLNWRDAVILAVSTLAMAAVHLGDGSSVWAIMAGVVGLVLLAIIVADSKGR